MELVVEELTQKKGGLGGTGYMVVWRSLADGAKSGSAVISREPNRTYSFTICISHTYALPELNIHTLICYLKGTDLKAVNWLEWCQLLLHQTPQRVLKE